MRRSAGVRALFVFASSLAMLLIASCANDDSPTAPIESVPGNGWFNGEILDSETGVCIGGAQAEVIAGRLAGTVYPQIRECQQFESGFQVTGLPVGEVLRLRASAAGYASVELDAVIEPIGNQARFTDITLKRVQ